MKEEKSIKTFSSGFVKDEYILLSRWTFP